MACITVWLNRRWEVRTLKRDVLRRLVGYSYRLTTRLVGTDGEPFVAFNEAAVVYSKHKAVVNALKKMRDRPGVLENDFVDLVTKMAKAAKIPTDELNHDLLTQPLTPP